jgi:surface polysaccharide O-acyltransferase-like enzyme
MCTIPDLLAIRKPATPAPAERRVAAAPAPLRLEGADALRALATIAVVVVHTSHWPLQDAGADLSTWSSVDLGSRFCVPAFVVLSGLLLGLRDGARDRPWPFLRRRLRRTLVPFLAWAPVYFAAGLWVTGDLVDVGRGGLIGWWLGGAGHLYFLLLIPQLYAAFLLWPRRLRPTLWLAGAAMAVQVVLETVRLAGPMPSTLEGVSLWKGYELLPFWIGYFATGVAAGRLLALRRDRADHPRAALACLAMVPAAVALLLASPVDRLRHGDFAQGTGAFLRPLLVPVVLTVTGAVLLGAPAVLRRLPRLAPPLRALSRDSLGVYITHPLIAFLLGHYLLDSMLQRHLPGSALGFVLLTAATLALALLITRLISASPLAPLIGAERLRLPVFALGADAPNGTGASPTPSAPSSLTAFPLSAADHDEGDELLDRGQRPVVAHHPGLRRVD